MATTPRLDPYVRLSRPGYTRYDLQYDEWRKQLRGLTGIKTRREMARSPYGALILRAATLVYRRLGWRVDPASEAKADQDAAAYLETCLHDLNQPWPNFINQVVASVFEQGYALFEITYKLRQGEQDPESDQPTSKYDDNKIGWRGLDFIPPETVIDDWDIPLGRSWQGAWQQPPEGGRVYLPKTKLLLFRLDDRTGSPVGSGGVFDDMYRAWHYLTELQRIDGITRERHGGIPLIKLGPGATTDTTDPTSDWSLARQAVEQFQVNEQSGFVVPDGWDVQILSPGEGSKDMQAALDGYKRDFFMGALAQWAMLGASSVGSYSLSKDQTDFYVMALEGWLGSIVQVLNEVAVSRLFALNPFPGLTGYPKLAHDPITRRDGLSFADTLTKLSQGWVTPTPEDEEFLRREYELPERTAEDIQAEQEAAAEAATEAAARMAAQAQANPPTPTQGETPPAPVMSASELAQMRRELYHTRMTLAQLLDQREAAP
jgi:hypothetical protein